jgi:hypothetical protein
VKAVNLADLEAQLLVNGWIVVSEPVANPQDPGQVRDGGYRVTLRTLTGDSYDGAGVTRADALRTAADNAGLIDPGQPHLQ